MLIRYILNNPGTIQLKPAFAVLAYFPRNSIIPTSTGLTILTPKTNNATTRNANNAISMSNTPSP
jgi:hypothetical protein